MAHLLVDLGLLRRAERRDLAVLGEPLHEARVVDGADVTVGQRECDALGEAQRAFARGLFVDRVEGLRERGERHGPRLYDQCRISSFQASCSGSSRTSTRGWASRNTSVFASYIVGRGSPHFALNSSNSVSRAVGFALYGIENVSSRARPPVTSIAIFVAVRSHSVGSSVSTSVLRFAIASSSLNIALTSSTERPRTGAPSSVSGCSPNSCAAGRKCSNARSWLMPSA